jgi:hypothetical protein
MGEATLAGRPSSRFNKPQAYLRAAMKLHHLPTTGRSALRLAISLVNYLAGQLRRSRRHQWNCPRRPIMRARRSLCLARPIQDRNGSPKDTNSGCLIRVDRYFHQFSLLQLIPTFIFGFPAHTRDTHLYYYYVIPISLHCCLAFPVLASLSFFLLPFFFLSTASFLASCLSLPARNGKCSLELRH